MTGYPRSRLLREVAYIAHYLHWSYDEILRLDHVERQWWVAEVNRLRESLAKESEP